MFQYDVHNRKNLLKVQKLIKRKWNVMLSVCEVSTNQCFIHPSPLLNESRLHTWMRIYITCVTDRLHTRTKPDAQRTLFWPWASQITTHRCVMVSFQTLEKSWKYNSVMKVRNSHHFRCCNPINTELSRLHKRLHKHSVRRLCSKHHFIFTARLHLLVYYRYPSTDRQQDLHISHTVHLSTL